MYFGTYKRNLDEKGRLQIPSKLLKENCKCLYILKGFEGCISIYEEDKFEELAVKLNSMDYFDKTQRDFVRQASASINKLEIDSHGRLSLGKQVMEDYHISSDVTLIGVIDHLELWDTVAYAKYSIDANRSYDNAGRNN